MQYHRATGTYNNMLKYFIFLFFFSMIIIESVSAQLTDKDITDLKKRAIEEGWTFEIGENTATRRPTEELCGYINTDNQTYRKITLPDI